MISIFQLFRIIFGIILSIFIIYFVVSYLSTYIGIQQAGMQAAALRSFSQTLQHVYSYNDPQPFQEFRKTALNFTWILIGEEPRITVEGLGDWNLPVPAVIRPGQELWLERKALDWGWYEFWIVTGVPDEFLFIININDADSKDLWDRIEPFLPGNRTKYANCHGANLGTASKLDFFRVETGELCELKPGKNQALITISSSCSPWYQPYGLCINPNVNPNGHAYYQNESFTWNDELDLIALILGSNHQDIYQHSQGSLSKRLLESKRYFFQHHVGLAAKTAAERARKLADYIEDKKREGKISPNADVVNCVQKLDDFADLLDQIAENPSKDKLDRSAQLYDDLVESGCEVRE
ncbi:MAG: hypothetical protein DRP12_01015 [Candidatus Aenigmatarchaeota archaeon]|nr:MAG: hypothetical protein DRP12_01015 [Candidatus Aenigmarchaeota archaeon]